jgi:hypothetical protein
MNVQEYLSQSGNAGSKESLQSNQLKLKTSRGDLPVWSKPMAGSRDFISENINAFREIMNNGESFIFPFYLGMSEKSAKKLGTDIKITNEVSTIFLPFFSIIGKVNQVELRNKEWAYLHFLLGGKDFSVAVSPLGFNENKERITYEVKTANHSLSDYQNEGYVRNKFPNGYEYYDIEKKNYSSSVTSRYIANGNMRGITLNELKNLKERAVALGLNPASDYNFCDYTYEVGPYTWPSAWYTKEGVPIVDAIFVAPMLKSLKT